MPLDTGVTCFVKGCVHWTWGNRCSARHIDIASQVEGEALSLDDHTECQTFRYRADWDDLMAAADNVNLSGLIAEPVMPGRQMDPAIRCRVDNCVFWGEGDRVYRPRHSGRGQTGRLLPRHRLWDFSRQ